MRNLKKTLRPARLGLVLSAVFLCTLHASAAVSTAFTYDGRLSDGGNPANGIYDLRFTIHDALVAGTQQGPTLTNSATAVTNGLFTVTLDFGNQFPGADRWIEIAVRPNGGGAFSTLAPRQKISATPYAVQSENANTAATASSVAAGNITGTINLAQLPTVIVTNGASGVNISLAPGSVGSAQLAPGALAAPVTGAGNAVNATANTSYVINGPGTTPVVLPTNANIGDVIQITGQGAGAPLNPVNWLQSSAPSAGWSSLASSSDGRYLAGAVVGGRIHTSTNFGTTWTLQTNAPTSPFSCAVASSADGSRLVVAIFDGGIYTSTNFGVDWALTTAPITRWRAVASSADGSHLLAGQDGSNLYVSTNFGATWTIYLAASSPANWRGVASSADGRNLVGVGDDGPVSTSTNFGVNWTQQPFIPGIGSWYSVASSADGRRLIAGAGELFISTNFGVNWTAQTGVLTNGANWSSVASSSDGSRLAAVAAGNGLYTSTDFGATWTLQTAVPTNAAWKAVALSSDGSRVAAAVNGGGIYLGVLPIPGQVAGGWAAIGVGGWSQGSAPGAYWSSLASSSDGQYLAAGAAYGGVYTSTNFGMDWALQTNVPTSPFTYPVASSSDGRRLVAAVKDGGIYTSTNFGVTWSQTTAPVTDWRCVASSADGSRLAAGGISSSLYVSTDYGATWTPYQAYQLTQIWVGLASSADGSHLAAVSDDGVLVTSTNFGVTWTLSFTGPGWFSVVSSADGSHLVAGAQSFGRIYTSTDFGANWILRTPGPASGGWKSVASSADGSRLAAASPGKGLYTSADFGATWTLQTAVPTNAFWNAVAVSSDGNRFVAAVSGGGIYVAPGFTSGGAGTSGSFQYLGNGQWGAISLAPSSLPTNVVFNAATGVTLGGTFSGDGSGLTSLNAASLTGTIASNSIAAGSIGSAQIADGTIVNADISSSAAIAYSKLNLANSILSSDLADGTIVNADVGPSAAIAYSKLSLANSLLSSDIVDGTIANADISASAGIAYSKLNFANSIVNADINSSAAIAYSKLNLANGIVNADVSPSAAIADTKLATISTLGKVADSALSANVALLGANNSFTATNALNDRDLRLRGLIDPNHGLGWYGSGKAFGGFAPDGPMLFGYSAGGLGTTITTQRVALVWNSAGSVGIGTASPSAARLDVSSTTQLSERLRLSGAEFYQPGNSDTHGLSLLLGVNRTDNRQLWIADSARLGQSAANPILRVNIGSVASIDSMGTDGLTPRSLYLGPNQLLTLATNNGGGVGIGAPAPESPLTVTKSGGSGTVHASATFSDAINSTLRIAHPAGGVVAWGGNVGHDLQVGGFSGTSSFTPLMTVKSSGDVGIGVTNPSAKLHVTGTIQAAQLNVGAGHTFTGQGNSIASGQDNSISSGVNNSVIAGGQGNIISNSSTHSFIGGGYLNRVLPGASHAVIPGGYGNKAANGSFAAGHLAEATNGNCFVWGDGYTNPLIEGPSRTWSTNDFSVTFRATGGYRLFTGVTDSGVYLPPGGGGWVNMSDRNAKENLVPVNSTEMLAKVVALPMSTWNYKSQDASIRHVGPMAQDFKAAFGVGESETGITTVDADGVALAAIQGLNQKMEAENANLRSENAELKSRLERLEALVNQSLNGTAK